MIIKEISCKTTLSPSKLPGLSYSLNPYLGCMHQCMYCYAPGILHMKHSDWKSSITVKRNLPLILSKEVKQKRPGTIGISTVTDPYQPLEKTYNITRYCLEILKNHTFPLCIQTKSDLILRDKDLIAECHDVEVMISIGTIDDDQRRILEPHSPSIKNRLKVLSSFVDSNVKTSVFFGPIYPTITISDIPVIIDLFKEKGVNEIMLDSLHLKPGIIPSLEEIAQQHQQFQSICSLDHIQSYQQRFRLIRKEIHRYGKLKKMIITDAF